MKELAIRRRNLDQFCGKESVLIGFELETVVAASKIGIFEILSIAVGQNTTDQSAVKIEFHAKRDFRMVDALSPASNGVRLYMIDVTSQRATLQDILDAVFDRGEILPAQIT
ncbi:hypothetical protein CWO89_43430 [Bradyrhizobium sp. Leo170]|nr:hypothetical protein CWO89_43430 [Bradyrhizobium sp. Leo170]